MARALHALGLVVLLVGCRVNGLSPYPAAALFTATAVGATAVNRAVTGDCWAVCRTGWHCNHDTGLCDEDEPSDAPAPHPEPAPGPR